MMRFRMISTIWAPPAASAQNISPVTGLIAAPATGRLPSSRQIAGVQIGMRVAKARVPSSESTTQERVSPAAGGLSSSVSSPMKP